MPKLPQFTPEDFCTALNLTSPQRPQGDPPLLAALRAGLHSYRRALLYSVPASRPASPFTEFALLDWGMDVNSPGQSLRYGSLLAALVVFGCGQNEPQTPVCGRVFFHGRPLPGGTIVFTPDAERGGRGPLASGEIDAEGRYTLHSGDQAGAVPGWYRVTIAPPSPVAAPGQAASPAVTLPRKYSDPEQSGLLRQVSAGKTAEQDFHLE